MSFTDNELATASPTLTPRRRKLLAAELIKSSDFYQERPGKYSDIRAVLVGLADEEDIRAMNAACTRLQIIGPNEKELNVDGYSEVSHETRESVAKFVFAYLYDDSDTTTSTDPYVTSGGSVGSRSGPIHLSCGHRRCGCGRY